MNDRRYYSVRTGKTDGSIEIDLDILKRLFFNVFSNYYENGYFQQVLGYWCTDEGFVSGKAGSDLELFFLTKLRKYDIWPIHEKYQGYREDDLFDVIEILYDSVSKPLEGTYHSWNNCGMHYSTFDQAPGQEEFRKDVNEFLKEYKEGFELSPNGEILIVGDIGLKQLLEAQIPNFDPENIDNRMRTAILKFRRHKSSAQDRKDATRDLADVLEFLRPKLANVIMTKDESDLFNIANNFAIRHHNTKQKTDYDPVWLSWIFYVYLATIHLSIRLIARNTGE